MSTNTTNALNTTNTGVEKAQGQSAGAFAASLVASIVVFAIETGIFLLIKDRFTRIYQPRTYLVPERERTKAADPGWWRWIKPVLTTSNSEFIQKCGLDAYFFLRYLRTLLKIFVPAACVILPILLPLNKINGRGSQFAVGQYKNQSNVTGLDQLAWGNIAPTHTGRYWAHWILAVALIAYVCYIAFDELRGYIRMRQAYLTSPQHRLRASATTVLVSSIPHKWCTVEALDGLYDVFPGGLRNIWINRNFDELNDKVKRRDDLALTLEAAETNLVKMCWQANEKKKKKDAKTAGKKTTKEEKIQDDAFKNEMARQNAQGGGLSAGNPHQVRHTVDEAISGVSDASSETEGEDVSPEHDKKGKSFFNVKAGFEKVGRGVLGGLQKAEKDLNETIDTTNGYVPPADDSGPRDFHQPGAYGPANSNSSSKPKAMASDLPAARDQLQGRKAMGQDLSTNARPSGESGFDRPRDSQQRDTRPLNSMSPTPDSVSGNKPSTNEKSGRFSAIMKLVGLGSDEREPVEYPEAFNVEWERDDENAAWRKYIKEKDRDTMRLPIFGWQWMISLPLVGEKVDTIYYCRKEVARLNAEIEEDQAHPERFPLMNSAFIQFNHQVAAHMACQSLSHHLPQQMAPRIVEISPNDVLWDNMSIPWWQRYIRTSAVVTVVAAMIILWAIPVALTSTIAQIHTLAQQIVWLRWLLKAPSWVLSTLQGVLPAVFLGILMFLLPLILRFLVRLQGVQSGMLVELKVQQYYFFFLFVQVFLVVSVASTATLIVSIFQNISNISSILNILPNTLASEIPKASNYFFSYMLLQALSVSAGALVQIGGLVGWFILAPILDSTARSKFKRQINLNEVNWGTFFPVYTNLAVIGLIYSVISPLILVFNIITFSLFWFVYRYNTLYVTKFTRDTGGLLYPNAINSTFVGIYASELLLTIMFFLIKDEHNNLACTGQGIGMAVVLACTAIYQYLLNDAFSPLFRYLPITLEDDAVRRDEEFARALNKRHGILEDDDDNEDLQHALEDRERREREEDRMAEDIEMKQIEASKHRQNEAESSWRNQIQNPEINLDADQPGMLLKMTKSAVQKTADLTVKKITPPKNRRRSSWADKENNRRSKNFGQYPSSVSVSTRKSHPSPHPQHAQHSHQHSDHKVVDVLNNLNNFNPLLGDSGQLEAAQAARNELSNALFGGVHDELEDLTPDQRDALVQRAFQHTALRAKRPVIWLPRDNMGVSDDEVRHMATFSEYLWVSNARQGLDAKGKCVYSGAPPDFSEVDLIEL